MKLSLESAPFDLDYTLNCGQVFRWEKRGKYWYGIVGEAIIKIRQDRGELFFQTFPDGRGVDFIQNYFRLDDDLPRIASKIGRDPTIRRAIEELYGLRLIRQDPWECLISYICATFSNIPRIKGMIRNLSQKFGREASYEGTAIHIFPTREALAKATLGELSDCGLGFRSKYVQGASKTMNDCNFDLESLRRLTYGEAKKQLLNLPGVGPKVADCILLFSLDKLEAFPVDVWVRRVISRHYDQHFPPELLKEKRLTRGRYEQISAFGRDYFGEYAGYAQEYLFYYYRVHSSTLGEISSGSLI